MLRDFIALTLAITLWFVVRVTRTGVATQTQMQMVVPILVKGQDPGLILYDKSHDQVKITVQGDTQEVSLLRETHMEAYIDLTGEKAISVFPQVKVIVPGRVKLVSVQPETINVRQAPESSKVIPLRIKISGLPAKGRSQGKVSLEPNDVRILGPEPLIQEVIEARAHIHLAGQTESTTFEVRDLTPVNREGQAVEARLARLKTSPAIVYATVPIEAESRAVGVAVSLANVRVEKVAGWSTSLELEPPFVTLNLAKDQQPPEYLVTRPEVFAASTRVQSHEVPLEIPDGFEVIGSPSIKIRVIPTRIAPEPTPQPSPTPRPTPRPGSSN